MKEEDLQLVVGKEKLGKTALILAVEKIPTLIVFLDNSNNLRGGAPGVVKYLQHELKKEVYILSGDSK